MPKGPTHSREPPRHRGLQHSSSAQITHTLSRRPNFLDTAHRRQGVTLRSELNNCSWPKSARCAGAFGCFCLDLGLLGHLQRVIDLDSEVTHRALQLGVAQKELHRPEVLRPAIDE